jgi:hypothetical protein
MRPCYGFGLSAFLVSTASAQESPGLVEELCEPGEASSLCADVPYCCTKDRLEVTFDGSSAAVLVMAPFALGAPIDTTVIIDASSPGTQGWSFGVAHDESYLSLESVTIDGTAAAVAREDGFHVASSEAIETCASPTRHCAESTPGGGYICAVILSFRRGLELPPGRQSVCRAAYYTADDPGPAGTFIRPVHRKLRRRGSPPVDINITVGGQTRLPHRLVAGWIGSSAPPPFEDCDNQEDDNADGFTDCDDPLCAADWRCLPPTEICTGGQDEDGNGLIDCDDPACAATPPCGARPEDCQNGIDDDRDGNVDCQDAQCALAAPCLPPEECINGIDDDRDGAADCGDPDCRDDPECAARPEDCANGRDDDRDGDFDCYDPDCRSEAPCQPLPEDCANRRDDDFDRRTDCADPDCDGQPACAPRAEECGNGFDDDRDGEVDCRDVDCSGEPSCRGDHPREGFPGRLVEVCDNCRDDDGNGKVDCEDAGCASAAHCASADPDCPDDALYFGLSPAVAPHRVSCGRLSISLRHRFPVTSFQLGVHQLELSTHTEYRFSSGLGDGDGSPVRTTIVLEGGDERTPLARNVAEGPPGDGVLTVERGPALSGFEGSDFFTVDLAPSRGGPGFTVLYVVESAGTSGDGFIPASEEAGACRAQEIVRVQVGRPAVSFRRGDVDGSGRLSVADAIAHLQIVFGRRAPNFDCEDVLDLSDDGKVNVLDSLWALQYVFSRGRSPPGPYPLCGLDSSAEWTPLRCEEPNCDD